MQEANGDRFCALLQQKMGGRADIVTTERGQLFTAIIHPAADFTAQIARHEGRRFLVDHVVDIGAVGAADLQHIAKTFGGDQAGDDAFAFGEGVDDHRSAMNEEIHRGRFARGLVEGMDDAITKIGGGGGDFGDA